MSIMSSRLAFAMLLATAPYISTCEGDEWVDRGSGLACASFRVGTDLSAADWGLEGQAEVDFGLAMQAIADVSVSAHTLVTDVGVACREIALGLGEQANAVDEMDAVVRAEAWCALARDALPALQAEIEEHGSLTVKHQAPFCFFSAAERALCELKCTTAANCNAELLDVASRCEPDSLFGQCTGTCGGRCVGSVDLPVACNGVCAGSCEGECSNGCVSDPDGSNCVGACSGTCVGKCRGACEVEVNASESCEGVCDSDCDGELQAPTCSHALMYPPERCVGAEQCNQSCAASAETKAECFLPVLTVEVKGDISEELSMSLGRKTAVLEQHLPVIAVVAGARSERVLMHARALLEIANRLDAAMVGESTARICLPWALPAARDAVTHAETGGDLAASIMGAL